MRAVVHTTTAFLLLLVLFATGIAPVQSAPDAAGPPPCCAHDRAEADAETACPTVECPHCGGLPMALPDRVTCCTILNVREYRFIAAGQYPPEIFPPPLEYPPKA